MKRKALGLVPARGGSKGVPGKNKRLVAGKPLIQWTIEAGLEAETVETVVVSTDDVEIAEISRGCGAEVIMRPSEIAGDTAPVIEAVRHVVSVLRKQGADAPECIALLQPTAPMRLPADIDGAVSLFFEQQPAPVCSVVQVEDNHPARMYVISENGSLNPLFPEMAVARRQDLPPVFHRNGAVYVFGPREIASGDIISERMRPYLMPAERSLNIDTELDLTVINALMTRQ